jgi:hypothetical protein
LLNSWLRESRLNHLPQGSCIVSSKAQLSARDGQEKGPKHNGQNITYPLIARLYPGMERQFCMFVGLQVGYLVGRNISYVSQDSTPEDIMSTLVSKHRLFSKFLPEERMFPPLRRASIK